MDWEINRAFGLKTLFAPYVGGQKKERGPRSSSALLWLGREDSNLRYTGPKPVALPLGYAPRAANEGAKSIVEQARKVKKGAIWRNRPPKPFSLPISPGNRAADPPKGEPAVLLTRGNPLQ